MSGDPASGVGILTALAAGIVSFLSPCVLPLVPGYLSAVTGLAAADLERANWRRVLVPSLLFVASFSTIFILLPAAGCHQSDTGRPYPGESMGVQCDGDVVIVCACRIRPKEPRRGPP